MIDRIMMAVRMDFLAMIKRPAINVRKAFSVLIISTLLVASLNVFLNMSQLKLKNGFQQIAKHEFVIRNGKIVMDSSQLEQLNASLQNDGLYIEETKVSFGRKDAISFQQILLLSGQEELTSEKVSDSLVNQTDMINNLLFFYFYLKELFLLVWTVILVIVLARTTQKYIRRRVDISFTKVFDCVTSLATIPLFAYLLLSGFGLSWSMRLFIFTLIYTLLVFVFARYSVANTLIEDEKINDNGDR